MRTYRHHPCDGTHATHRAKAECIFGGPLVVEGDGPFATITRCRVPSLSLHPTQAEADDALAVLNQFRCGPGCYRNHEVALIHLPTNPTTGDPR